VPVTEAFVPNVKVDEVNGVAPLTWSRAWDSSAPTSDRPQHRLELVVLTWAPASQFIATSVAGQLCPSRGGSDRKAVDIVASRIITATHQRPAQGGQFAHLPECRNTGAGAEHKYWMDDGEMARSRPAHRRQPTRTSAAS